MAEQEPHADRPPAPPPLREMALIVGVGLVVVIAACWWLGLLSSPEGGSHLAPMARAGGRERTGPYAGSRTCGECHPGEYAFFTRSGHARTLHRAARLPLAARLDGRVAADPEHPGVSWAYHLRDGRFEVDRNNDAGESRRLLIEYALGSGHHATTFVTMTDPAVPTALEHRLTHYTDGDRLAITPGQRAERPSPGTTSRGRELNPAEVTKCFGCHSTRTSATRGGELDVEALIPNVSCERCHGPGRVHVAAARSGRSDLSLPLVPGDGSAAAQLELCGQCHRHPSRAVPGLIRPDNTELARFQPVGLMQSKCYTRGDGSLRCTTCHDPHRRASANRAGYEATCLGCHAPARDAACPVSPASGCVDCHMPRVDSGQSVFFTDHWIRVRKDAGATRAR